jgi:hypothetical protein
MTTPLHLIPRLPNEVAERLGWYVYLYVDPRTGVPFYIGKGKGTRILDHFEDTADSAKTRVLAELQALGLAPRLEVLAHALKDEDTALCVEAAAIDLLGIGQLTNAVRGWNSVQRGRMSLEQLVGYYAAEPVTIEHAVLLIRINAEYRHNMTALELQDATRGVWKLGERREGVRYALAVFEGVVREVYEVHAWHPGLTQPYTSRVVSETDAKGRWEFDGNIASEPVRSLYRLKSVSAYLKRGLQSPTLYVNC